MNACESYEVHISALLDGEATRADTILVLDHLPQCDSCCEFYRQAQELQGLVDARPLAPGATAAIEQRAQQRGDALLLEQSVDVAEAASGHVVAQRATVVPLERTPRWIWGLAASLLVALGFGLGSVGGAALVGGALPSGDLQVEIGANAGYMTDERFVALAVELLQSDRKYHNKMSEVLREVQSERMLEAGNGEAASWSDESPLSIRSEEGGRRGMGELLRLSPLQNVY